jgi:hypothetical protein
MLVPVTTIDPIGQVENVVYQILSYGLMHVLTLER